MLKFSQSSGENDWLQALRDQASDTCVLVTVVHTRGSAPRAAGTKMLVMSDHCVGTIGGGHLEFRAIESAQQLLSGAKTPARCLEKIPLGASLGQCCGGLVELLFERISNPSALWIDALALCSDSNTAAIVVTSLSQGPTEQNNISKLIVTDSDCFGELPYADREQAMKAISHARDMLSGSTTTAEQLDEHFYDAINQYKFHIMLFGAGHVGQAVVSVLQALSCRITWVDNRDGIFPDSVPANVTIVPCDEPEDAIDDAAAGTYVLIMTHNHQLDLSICERALKQSTLSFCGLIGSSNKSNRFRKRLLARGLKDSVVNRLICPIGVDGINGKEPGVIAIAVTAQLLQHAENEALLSKETQRATVPYKMPYKVKNQP